MAFRSYLLQHARAGQTPVGDFIRDARSDPNDVPDIRSWEQLKTYLMLRNACRECVEAAHACWTNYLHWSASHPTGIPYG